MASLSSSNQQESPETSKSCTFSVETRIRPARDGIAVSLRLVDTSSPKNTDMDSDQLGIRPVGWVSPNTWDSRSKSSFDDLAECPKGPQGYPRTWIQPLTPLLRSNRDRTTCIRTVRFAEEPCTPCMQRKHGTKAQECRYRRSYLEAQEKPINPNEHFLESRSHHRNAQDSSACSSEECHYLSEGNNEKKETVPESFTSPVLRTSEKCHIVVQGQPQDVDRSSYLEMIPRLHVVPGRKTTAFGLVSPKLNRRRLPAQDGSRDQNVTGPQMNLSGLSSNSHMPHDAEKPLGRSSPPPLKADGLLNTRVMCLTGGKDRSGRAVLEVYGDHQVWSSASISSQELSKVLLYLHTISRKEIKDLGMTLVFDARKKPPHPEFLTALLIVQELNPCAIHWVLMLVNKDNSLEKSSGVKTELISSLKALNKLVDVGLLTEALHGSFQYYHSDWLQIHQKLFPFVSDLQEASALLTGAIKKLEGVRKIDTVQEVQQCIKEQGGLMKAVLEDARLVHLQRAGGAMLARLRRETDLRSPHCTQSHEVIDTVTDLYNEMEEQVHVLARKSNMSLQHLDFLLELRETESRLAQVRDWFQSEGEARLIQAESVDESSEKIQQTLQGFKGFLAEVDERKQQAMEMVAEAEGLQGPNYPEVEVFLNTVSMLKSSLADFLSRAERCGEELESLVYISHFCERASVVAGECRVVLEQEQCHCGAGEEESRARLRVCLRRLDGFSPQHFQEVRVSLPRALQVWNAAWIHCQDVRQQLEERLVLMEETRRGGAWPEPEEEESRSGHARDSHARDSHALSHARDSHAQDSHTLSPARDSHARDSIHGTVSCFNFRSRRGSKTAAESKARGGAEDQRAGQEKPVVGSGAVGCQWFPWQHGDSRRSSQCPLSPRSGSQGPHGDTDPARDPDLFTRGCPHSPSKAMKLRRVMEELLLTEVDYVESLRYILTHYCPLLDRADVPQDLRGQRGRIFGNLEKLCQFHGLHFQQELQACQAEPLRVGRCFLRHRESFGLYALYSKNKPQSDTLIRHHKYFKLKQTELGDSLDLSSYLLKPIQRISKYSLLLQEILQDCVSPSQSEEQQEIQAALEVVRFQLRHGNDLLTMDAIQDCDLNLNEQGQLIRQDEFWVIFRKKRALRRVFLFQDVILFTKTKKNECGDDVYTYKLSIKTCDIGMTHSSGLSGLCFEIWFRRRRSQDTYVLQAETPDVKEAWTRDLEQILWEQALKSRELRRQERMFMGMGWKPFQDIQSQKTPFNSHGHNGDVAGKEVMGMVKSTSLTVSGLQRDVTLPRPDSIGSSTSMAGSRSSSSSGRGSMSPSTFMGKYDAVDPGLFVCADHGCPLGRRRSVSSLLHSGPSVPPMALQRGSPALTRKNLFTPHTEFHRPLQFQEPIRSKASTEV